MTSHLRFRAAAYSPLDEMTNAMESAADRTWEIEQLLEQETGGQLTDAGSAALAMQEGGHQGDHLARDVRIVKARLLNEAKQHLQGYAAQLQTDPGASFDRDDLLTELAKATDDAGAAAGGAAADLCRKVALVVSGGWFLGVEGTTSIQLSDLITSPVMALPSAAELD